jgi:hypothetical protein
VPSHDHLLGRKILQKIKNYYLRSKKKVSSFSYRRYRPTFPCSKGAIYVVETANAALNAKVLGVVLAQLLSCKLLQAISILRLNGKQSKQIKI